jgi:hypothetical protein
MLLWAGREPVASFPGRLRPALLLCVWETDAAGKASVVGAGTLTSSRPALLSWLLLEQSEESKQND